ncbi:MAG: hypothetical protein ACXVW7_16615, partial [Trebonia sp.]
RSRCPAGAGREAAGSPGGRCAGQGQESRRGACRTQARRPGRESHVRLVHLTGSEASIGACRRFVTMQVRAAAQSLDRVAQDYDRLGELTGAN